MDAQRRFAIEQRLVQIEGERARLMQELETDNLSAIASDFRTYSSTHFPKAPNATVQIGSGWVEPQPLANPVGTALVDRLVDAQDRADLVAKQRGRG